MYKRIIKSFSEFVRYIWKIGRKDRMKQAVASNLLVAKTRDYETWSMPSQRPVPDPHILKHETCFWQYIIRLGTSCTKDTFIWCICHFVANQGELQMFSATCEVACLKPWTCVADQIMLMITGGSLTTRCGTMTLWSRRLRIRNYSHHKWSPTSTC